MFTKLDAKWKALCLAQPKMLAAIIFTFATAMIFVYLHVWGYREFAMWVLAAVLLPIPIEVWVMVRRRREPLPR